MRVGLCDNGVSNTCFWSFLPLALKDASEFMRYLLDEVEMDSTRNRNKRNKRNENNESNERDDSNERNVDEDMKDEIEGAESSMEGEREGEGKGKVCNPFTGYMEQVITCCVCSTESVSREIFQDLSLAIEEEGEGGSEGHRDEERGKAGHTSAQNSTPSLHNLLTAHFSDEILRGENAYMCETCMRRVHARKQIHVVTAPACLLLNMKPYR